VLFLSILIFGLFLVMQAKSKLADQNLIMVFVLGGIPAFEVFFFSSRPRDILFGDELRAFL
jgi:hypothetical protein